jgi:flagellar hook-associated protein 3 FlgL
VTSGNVIPVTGLPDDAPLYVEGGSIGFNGIEVAVNGVPESGDSFTIEPALNESIFSTVQRMIDNLNQPFDSAVQKAATLTESNQLLAQIDSALSNVLNSQSEIGSRMNLLASAQETNTNLKLICEETRKQLQEADPAEVATNFYTELVNLQAAQQSFVKLQGLSLLNYI